MMRRKTVVKRFHERLAKVAKELEYDAPVLHGENVIAWDGPFEWAIALLGGASVISSELGYWSGCLKCEKPLVSFIEKAEKEGYTFECATANSVSVY